MKKGLILILFLALFHVGCRREESGVSFAVGGAPSEIAYWEILIADFENASGIPVTIIRQPTDTDQRRQGLVVPLKAGQNDPDVFLMDVAWVPQFSASKWLLSLDSLLMNTDDFFRPVIEQVDKDRSGNLIALPVYLDCGLLYYRRDLLEKYGASPPETWEELLETARIVQEGERADHPNFYGFVWQGAQYEGLICNFLEFAASGGGELFRSSPEEQSFPVASKQNIRALAFMRDLIHKHKISPPNTFTEMKEEEVRQFFQRGDALFERNWPYAWKLHQQKDSTVRGKTGLTVLPRFREGRHAAALGGWHVGISRFTDTPEKSARLLEFIASFETQKRLALELGWNPGRKDIYDDPRVNSEIPHIGTLKKALEGAVARPPVPYYTRISSILQQYVNGVLAGRESPEQALENAEKDIEKARSEYE